MKIKSGFILRKIAGKYMAVPIGGRVSEMHGMAALNETAAFMWGILEHECTEQDIVTALLDEYDITEETASEEVKAFIAKISQENLLDD